MAFPTSPSNNDVHKEGNRAFVWDSTLGTWDQVKETDRLSSESGGGALGTLTVGQLPVGNEKMQTVQTSRHAMGTIANSNNVITLAFTPDRQSTKQLWFWQIQTRTVVGHFDAGGHHYYKLYLYNNTDSSTTIDKIQGGGGPASTGSAHNLCHSQYGFSTGTLLTTKEYEIRLYYVGGGNSLVDSTSGTGGGEYGPDVMLTGLLWE